MLRIISNIIIFEGNTTNRKFEIPVLTRCEIVSNRNTFTDTATLTFPVRLRNRNTELPRIRIGDRIEVYLGYFEYGLKKEFDGFITDVARNSPLIIKCEDQAFELKRRSLPATTLRQTDLNELITTFYTGETQILNAEVGDFRIAENATLIDVLDILKSKYGIFSYFRNGVLHVNTELTTNSGRRIFIGHQQRNIALGSDNLNFQENNDIGIISHGISVQRNGIKIELYARYRDNVLNNDIIVTEIKPLGTLNTLKIPNLSKSALTSLIRRRLPNLFYTGVTGSVVTFGYPSLTHGDTYQYQDERIPSRNGQYRINEVIKTFGVGIGYKQRPTLGYKTGNI